MEKWRGGTRMQLRPDRGQPRIEDGTTEVQIISMAGEESVEEASKQSATNRYCSPRNSGLASIGFVAVLGCFVTFGLISWAVHQNDHRLAASHGATPRELQRRSLSIFKKNGCRAMPRVERQPQLPIPPTYLATYPGSGSRPVRQLIKALTGGLRVQNEYEQQPKDDAVAIQTRYPHKSGTLVAWDKDIRRAIILIRNPLHALPTLFEELYATKKHLPVHFQPQEAVVVEDAASVGEWVSWRDRLFESQLMSYREFLRYWVKGYGHDDRLILPYEVLEHDRTGGEHATRLATFLGRLKEVPTVESGDAPCVWQMIFKQGGSHIEDDAEDGDAAADTEPRGAGRMLRSDGNDSHERITHRRLASYYIPHPSSIDAPIDARPFTAEQLRVMADVLQQTSDELYTHSHYLKRLLLRYRDEIIYILNAQDNGKADDVGVQGEDAPRTQPFHIFQVSPPGTESAITTNWLIGLFEPDAECSKLVTSPGLRVYQHDKEVPITATIVTQTNEPNMIGLYKIFKTGFDEVFFVVSKSGTDADRQIDEKACHYSNVLCIDPPSFTTEKELEALVHDLTLKFQRRFAKYFGQFGDVIGLGEQSAVSRLKQMHVAVAAMKNEPCEVVDPKFGVRGGLRNPGDRPVSVASERVVPRRLFYCGSTGSGPNTSHSILGIFLANAFFPEIVGEPPGEDRGQEKAIPLTSSSISDATPNDFLVYHMHQYCEVDVLTFPGQQLHVNHPTHGFSAYGKYTPPTDKVYVIGAHEDGPHSIQSAARPSP